MKLSEEETAALRGWWTREGAFSGDNNNFIFISLIDYSEDTAENGRYISGNFNEKLYWGGTTKVTDDGLVGTVQTTTKNENGEYIPGDPVDIKVTEEGESGILLTFGTGEEYHLVPAN